MKIDGFIKTLLAARIGDNRSIDDYEHGYNSGLKRAVSLARAFWNSLPFDAADAATAESASYRQSGLTVMRIIEEEGRDYAVIPVHELFRLERQIEEIAQGQAANTEKMREINSLLENQLTRSSQPNTPPRTQEGE